MYTYVGKGTTILGIRNKPVEQLKPGDRVLGYYVGVGTKCHTDSIVETIRYVGKAICKYVGSKSDFALVADGQKTIDPTFKYVDINDVIYSVSRTIPRPYKVHKTVETDIYLITLKDYDVVPLLSSYMFVAFSEQPINFQGDLGGEEKSSRSKPRRTKKQIDKEEVQEKEDEQKQTRKKQRTKRRKRKSRKESIDIHVSEG